MNKVKYIVFEDDLGQDAIMIFPSYVRHDSFLSLPGIKLSAGFVDFKFKLCYGQSISLKLRSRPEEDTKLLRELLGD